MLSQGFVETKLKTKFAEFCIRIYKEDLGKETLVLWTENLDVMQPILVRVHSECITGDMLGSLQCDCGKQLAKSLRMIGKEGGVCIYLRQEGRGIGLFEKMKSYQLQSEGYDTFEANILLGHQPDQRSYEKVKKVLDDLRIARIRLLTNNPSKISDIAKLGIEIVERVPLISKASKHNRMYLEAKRKKFQHLSIQSTPYYFYQFHIDTAQHMHSIIEFIRERKKDPLLKIGIGITADSFSLISESEMERISSIIKSCEKWPECIPIIHFSFSRSSNVLKDVNEIKKIWPSINRIQLNDLLLDIDNLKKICKLILVNIPLSNENFHFIHNTKFRNIIKKNKLFILLDNSKGRGIKESKESFTKKIDTLLDYGLNNIFLCGGFGPDRLDTYFEIRRYYRINFSIDAETYVKTHGRADVEKIKLYLSQLIRFDSPKQDGVEQTRKFLKEHHRLGWDKTMINGYEFAIHAKVFHAGHFPSSGWFGSELCSLVENDSNFCEIGCGSGVISCLVALSNPELQVTTTDISPYASKNTKVNAERLGLLSRITILTGDVLDSIQPEANFDSIFWALPFGFLDPGTEISLEEAQVFDPGYRSIRKFFQTAGYYLKPNGRLLIGFSTDLGHFTLLQELAAKHSIRLKKIKEKIMKEDVEITFEIFEGRIVSM